MKRSVIAVVLALFVLEAAAPAFAGKKGGRQHQGGHPGNHNNRKTVVVHRGWPIKRTLPTVVVVPAPRVVVAPRVYVAPLVWAAVVVNAFPASLTLVWEDSETLSRDAEWTEFTLVADRPGRKLFIEIHGEATLNFAEVVFANGDTHVVDFQEKTRGRGCYTLLDFEDGRKIDHVRMVARAETEDAKVILRMS